METGDRLSNTMSDQSPHRPGMGIELNGTSGEAEEKTRPVSMSSPSSSSSSSSSLSWLKRQNNNTCGISSESETSMEYPETPVTEEFKECTPKSQRIQTLEEASLSSDSLSLDVSINSRPSSTAGIQRRSGYYGRRTKEERAKLRADKIASGAANQSLPLALVNSSPAVPQATVTIASSYLDKVLQETMDTEKIYVKDLKDIIRVRLHLIWF